MRMYIYVSCCLSFLFSCLRVFFCFFILIFSLVLHSISLIPIFVKNILLNVYDRFLLLEFEYRLMSASNKGLIKNHLQIEIEFSSISLDKIEHKITFKYSGWYFWMWICVNSIVNVLHIYWSFADINQSESSLYILHDIVVSIRLGQHRRTWNKKIQKEKKTTRVRLSIEGNDFILRVLQNDSDFDYIRNYMHLHKLIRTFYMRTNFCECESEMPFIWFSFYNSFS